MNKKQTHGLINGVLGKIQYEAGKALGNNDLRRKGMEKMLFARIERTAGNAAEMIKSAMRRH